MNKRALTVIYVLLVIAIAGCSASTTQWPQFSGFLGDYKGMYRSSKIEGLFIVKHKTKNVNDYTQFLVDPVTVQLTPDAVGYNIPKKTFETLAKNLRNQVINALNENYTVVDRSGPAVLQIRIAITDVLSHGSSKVKAIMETDFGDSRTRERIAAILTSNEGMTFEEWAALLGNRLDPLNKETKVYRFE